MKNIGATQPGTHERTPVQHSWQSQPTFNLRTLRRCKARLHGLQNAKSWPGPAGKKIAGRQLSQDADAARPCPRIRLRQEAGQTLSAARTCFDEGDLRQLTTNELAYLVHDFGKMLRPPVVQEINTIVTLLAGELIARSAAGCLRPVTAKELALLTGGVSKGEGPFVGQALEALASTLLAPGALRPEEGWTGQPLSMMANGLGKGSGDTIRAALDKLAQTITDQCLTRQGGWNVQSLAMMANGLIKGDCEGAAVQAALVSLAWTVSRWGHPLEDPGCNPQSLAMLANALGKGDSDSPAIQAALNRLAQCVRDQDLAADPGWQAQSLSMLANGLSKVQGPDIAPAMARIAQAIPDLPQLTGQRGWTELALPMLANAFAKALPKEDPAREEAELQRCPGGGQTNAVSGGQSAACLQAGLNRLAQALCRRDINGKKEYWTVQHLVMMANALGKGTGPDIRPALAHMARAIRARDLTCRQDWIPQNLAVLANAFGKIEEDDDGQQALSWLAQAVRGRDLKTESDWACRHLAMMTCGLGRGAGPDIEAALIQLAEVVKNRELRPQQGWISQNLGMMANAFAKVEGYEVAQEALVHLALAILDDTAWDLSPQQGWSVQDLVMLANGLSKGRDRACRRGLARIGQALRSRCLTTERLWRTQDLVIMTNALEKAAEEDAVQQALTQLAQTVRQRPLEAEAGWTPLALSLMAHGLGRGSGPAVVQALTHLARAIMARDLGVCVRSQSIAAPGPGPAGHWTEHALAMLANGLGKGKGEVIRQALVRIACEVLRRRQAVQQEWTVQHLTMVAYGIGKAADQQEVQEALMCLAQAVSAQPLTEETGWTAHPLSIMAYELAKCPEQAGLEALNHQILALRGRPLTSEAGWSPLSLSMMMEGAGQALHDSPLFEELGAALAERAGQAPTLLVSVLGTLCRFALSAHHLRAAGHLMNALRAHNFQPRSRREKEVLLWSATLFHFACQRLQPEDPRLADSFETCCRHYLSCQLAAGNESGEDSFCHDYWHKSWACAWWRRLTDPDTGRPGGQVGPPGTTVSLRQQKIFEQLQRVLPGHKLAMEVVIRDFAVDIVIDDRVCVEVDGPDHFVAVPAMDGKGTGDGFVRKRRTKDHFIDHMLRQFGYQVFRIAVGRNDDRVRALAGEIRAALALPGHRERALAESAQATVGV